MLDSIQGWQDVMCHLLRCHVSLEDRKQWQAPGWKKPLRSVKRSELSKSFPRLPGIAQSPSNASDEETIPSSAPVAQVVGPASLPQHAATCHQDLARAALPLFLPRTLHLGCRMGQGIAEVLSPGLLRPLVSKFTSRSLLGSFASMPAAAWGSCACL